MIDYQVRLINFPPGKVREAVTENEDGSYTIFIEENLSQSERQREGRDAMKRSAGGEFSNNDIQLIEYDAHAS